MYINFKTAKIMAKSMAFRFGMAFINYDGKDYYVTSKSHNNTVGVVNKIGKFSLFQAKSLK